MVRPMPSNDLARQLGYTYSTPGVARRAIIAAASSKTLSRVNAFWMHRFDRAVLVASRHRSTATSALTGMPVLFVTTTGARSGLPRSVPLLGIPFGTSLALIGTGFGQESTPGWVHNLRSDPAAVVAYRDARAEVTARLATDVEAEAIWSAAVAIYPGYLKYPVWASHRQISVFVLEPN